MLANTRESNPSLDLGDAIGHDMMHWPAFEYPYGMAPDTLKLQDDASNGMIFAGPPARQTFTRKSRTDPMSRALHAAGATVVDKTEYVRDCR